MSPKRILLIPALALLLYLGMYSWNQRTNFLDGLAANTGLESVGAVLKAFRFVQDTLTESWERYLNLMDVREENLLLRKQIADMQTRLILAAEEKAELQRLRSLLTITPPEAWLSLGARVLAGRMGSNAALDTVTVGRGFLTGATPGTPVMTPQGVVGRVLRAGPSTSTVLLLSDPGSRLAVVTQGGRVQGILVGGGPFKPLELRFVSHNSVVNKGELLVTSGLDEAYPKGLPVARVTMVGPPDSSSFLPVQAEPLADLATMEEVLMLARPRGSMTPTDAAPVFTPITEPLRQAVQP